MVNQDLLRKYAELVVKMGVNVQKDQPVLINADVKAHEFVNLCVEEAYKAGAGQVIVEWSNEHNALWDYEYRTKESLSEVPQWLYDKKEYAQKKGCCILSITSGTPGLLKNVDPEKLQAQQMAMTKKMQPLKTYTMANIGQWCVLGVPSAGWAKVVFPDMEEKEAVEALWNAILTSVRVKEDNDPVAEWDVHNQNLLNRGKKMNEYNFKELHFKNSLGTDLTVGLVENHIWAGGCEEASNGAIFNPNMPTEEIFCMPYKYGVNGKVVGTMPLTYQGKLIEGFWFEFKDGKVVNYGAEKEAELVKSLVEYDEGSCYLGEVALIAYDSPINEAGILFYNTLYDENASCHLALGRAYPMNVQGGTTMDPEQLKAAGANHSMIHQDFMFGSGDMYIDGIQKDGTVIPVFRDGKFVI